MFLALLNTRHLFPFLTCHDVYNTVSKSMITYMIFSAVATGEKPRNEIRKIKKYSSELLISGWANRWLLAILGLNLNLNLLNRLTVMQNIETHANSNHNMLNRGSTVSQFQKCKNVNLENI